MSEIVAEINDDSSFIFVYEFEIDEVALDFNDLWSIPPDWPTPFQGSLLAKK